MSSVLTWGLVVVLMIVCGVAMARLLWVADGKPPLRRPKSGTDQSQGAADEPSK